MRRARHAEGSPRESGQGLTTPMPWPCSGLHAAQAPVRPRHCTQALLQQLDLLIVSTLPRSASRALLDVRLRRLPRLRICAPALAVGDGGVDSPRVSGIMAPKCGNRAKAPRDVDTWTDTTPPLFVTI